MTIASKVRSEPLACPSAKTAQAKSFFLSVECAAVRAPAAMKAKPSKRAPKWSSSGMKKELHTSRGGKSSRSKALSDCSSTQAVRTGGKGGSYVWVAYGSGGYSRVARSRALNDHDRHRPDVSKGWSQRSFNPLRHGRYAGLLRKRRHY